MTILDKISLYLTAITIIMTQIFTIIPVATALFHHPKPGKGVEIMLKHPVNPIIAIGRPVMRHSSKDLLLTNIYSLINIRCNNHWIRLRIDTHFTITFT